MKCIARPIRGSVGICALSVLMFAGGCTLANQSTRSSRASAAPPQPITHSVQAPTATTTTAPVAATSNDRPPVRAEGPQRLKPLPLAPPAERAVSILEDAHRSDWALLRANALEALIVDPDLLREMVVASLVDENRGVRFVAAMAIGRAKLCELQEHVEPLLEDPSPSVRAAAIYASNACGVWVDPSPLAVMVASTEPEIRANAFMILGLMGNESAMPLIRSSLGVGMGLVDPVRIRLVDLQGAAALVRLGDEQEIEPIRAALFAPVEQSEITALAIQLISQLHDEGARQMLVRLVEAPSREARPAEIRLSAAEAIAELGAREPEPLLRLASEYLDSPQSVVRAQVASLLGVVDDATARALLSDLMQDPDPVVRVSAAGSYLKLEGLQGTATASVH